MQSLTNSVAAETVGVEQDKEETMDCGILSTPWVLGYIFKHGFSSASHALLFVPHTAEFFVTSLIEILLTFNILKHDGYLGVKEKWWGGRVEQNVGGSHEYVLWDVGWQQTLTKTVKLQWKAQQKGCLGLVEGRKWKLSLSRL